MRKTLAIRVLNLLLLSGAATFLSTCNTVAGVGEDISAIGNAITGGGDQSREQAALTRRATQSCLSRPGSEKAKGGRAMLQILLVVVLVLVVLSSLAAIPVIYRPILAMATAASVSYCRSF